MHLERPATVGSRLAASLALWLAACGQPDPPPKAPAPPSPPPKAQALPAAPSSPTLAKVRERGWLACGVHPALPGFAVRDDRGDWRGFDVDICRAVAAAVLGDAKAVRFTAVEAPQRFEALASGRVDILSRNTSWSFTRDAAGFAFPATTYFDGQGFLTTKALGLSSADELGGARICVQSATASADTLAEHFRVRGLSYRPVATASEAEAWRRYQDGECEAVTADVSALAAARSVMNNPNAHEILPDVISKEPLGPVVRQEDPVWTDIVAWTVHALVLAEETNVTSETDLAQVSRPDARRLLGLAGDLGPKLGLDAGWAANAIAQVGSYSEIFERNLGARTPLRLARGHNALWNAERPGLLYAPPLR